MKIATLAILAAAVTISGCSSGNFLVYKDAKHFYVTSKGETLRTMLCDSGDLARITRDAGLRDQLQSDLQSSICATDKVKERVLTVLEGMTPEERKALKLAFQTNGYQVNTIANC